MKTFIATLLLAAFLRVNCDLTDAERDSILDQHNDWRGNIGSSNMFKLCWDDDLEAIAQEWADGCTFGHNDQRSSKGYSKANYVGENIYMGTNSDVGAMLEAWYDENNGYDLDTNSCSGDTCLHYTQIMWATSKYIGCGKAQCDDQYYLVCNYGPAGNWAGKSPFTKGTACTECKNTDNCVDNCFCIL